MDTTIDTWTFPKFRAALESAVLCASRDSESIALMHVEVTPHYMHATDGCRLLRVGTQYVLPADGNPSTRSQPRIYIPWLTTKSILKTYTAKDIDKGLVGHCSLVQTESEHGPVVKFLYDGLVLATWEAGQPFTFPTCDRVIPDMAPSVEAAAAIRFDAVHLADVAKIAKLIDARTVTLFGPTVRGHTSPVVWGIEGRHSGLSALYVLVPVRV